MLASFQQQGQSGRYRETLLVAVHERHDGAELRIRAGLARYVSIAGAPFELFGVDRVTEPGGFCIEPVAPVPVWNIYLGDTAQRRGIGTLLFGMAVTWLKQHFHEATLAPFQATKSAVGFYAQFGFRECPDRECIVGEQKVDVLRVVRVGGWSLETPLADGAESRHFEREFRPCQFEATPAWSELRVADLWAS